MYCLHNANESILVYYREQEHPYVGMTAVYPYLPYITVSLNLTSKQLQAWNHQKTPAVKEITKQEVGSLVLKQFSGERSKNIKVNFNCFQHL